MTDHQKLVITCPHLSEIAVDISVCTLPTRNTTSSLCRVHIEQRDIVYHNINVIPVNSCLHVTGIWCET